MRKLLALSLLGVFLCVSLGCADLVTPRKAGSERIVGLGVRSVIDRFKANERALVMISGKGSSCLGLYVFDAQGNCVSKHDITSPQSSDDLCADWIPGAASAFSVEIRNGGHNLNEYGFGIR